MPEFYKRTRLIITAFDTEDVITTSGGTPVDDFTPEDPIEAELVEPTFTYGSSVNPFWY